MICDLKDTYRYELGDQTIFQKILSRFMMRHNFNLVLPYNLFHGRIHTLTHTMNKTPLNMDIWSLIFDHILFPKSKLIRLEMVSVQDDAGLSHPIPLLILLSAVCQSWRHYLNRTLPEYWFQLTPQSSAISLQSLNHWFYAGGRWSLYFMDPWRMHTSFTRTRERRPWFLWLGVWDGFNVWKVFNQKTGQEWPWSEPWMLRSRNEQCDLLEQDLCVKFDVEFLDYGVITHENSQIMVRLVRAITDRRMQLPLDSALMQWKRQRHLIQLYLDGCRASGMPPSFTVFYHETYRFLMMDFLQFLTSGEHYHSA